MVLVPDHQRGHRLSLHRVYKWSGSGLREEQVGQVQSGEQVKFDEKILKRHCLIV